MKLYRTPTGHWAGTKDEAITIAKAHDTTYEQYDVPYDKAGLLAFLNGFKVGAEQTSQAPVPAPTPTPVVFAETVHQKQLHRMAVEDFILESSLDTALALNELVMCRMRDFVRGK
jgi:hypothetical protein